MLSARHLPLILLPLVTFTGCGTVQELTQGGKVQHLAAASLEYAYTAMVSVNAGESLSALETRCKGKILVYKPENGFALVGYTRDTDAPVSVRPNLELNKASFLGGGQLAWAVGKVTAWSGGKITAWSGGKVTAWSGGQYMVIPENTGTWKQIRLEQGQQLAPRLGWGVKVAVIDTGIDLNHPAFAGSIDTDNMWDFVGGDALPQDEGLLGQGATGHGTNVAGIVLQIAPKVTILPLRVLGSDGSGDTSRVAAAIVYAVEHGAQVINLSLGSDKISMAVQGAINVAGANGVSVIASAGNTGDTNVTYPASLAFVKLTSAGLYSLSVGSVNATDQKSTFSTYGQQPKPLEIVAPGENVYAPAPNNRLAAWTGTSMSTPMISGALALALGERRLDQAFLENALMSYSANIYQNHLNDPYKDVLGKGRLDVENFLGHVVKP